MNHPYNLNCQKKISIGKQYDGYGNKHPVPKEAILKHNNGNINNTKITIITPPFIQTLNKPITSVTMDATCLQRKKVLVDFTGILTVVAYSNAANSVLFSFKLFKSTKDILHQFEAAFDFYYNKFSLSGTPITSTLVFQYSPGNYNYNYENCCTYTLELSELSGISPLFMEVSINGTLSVLALNSPS